MSSNGSESATEHLDLWRDRLLDAIDDSLSAADAQSVYAHLETCEHCKAEQRRLRRVDAHLRAELPTRPVPTASFDARLLARIDELAADARAAAHKRELREHYERLARLHYSWRDFWRFNLGNMLGVIALLVTAFVALATTTDAWSARALNLIRGFEYRSILDWPTLSVVALCATGLVTLTMWLVNTGTRRLD